MKIAVIDGLGGGLGCQIIKGLKDKFSDTVELIALGTNAIATSKMLNAGADRGATGANAIKVTVARVDVIVGPLGIIVPNAMLGEITKAAAEAVADSPAKRFLLAIRQPHIGLVGIKEENSINELVEELIAKVEGYIA